MRVASDRNRLTDPVYALAAGRPYRSVLLDNVVPDQCEVFCDSTHLDLHEQILLIRATHAYINIGIIPADLQFRGSTLCGGEKR